MLNRKVAKRAQNGLSGRFDYTIQHYRKFSILRIKLIERDRTVKGEGKDMLVRMNLCIKNQAVKSEEEISREGTHVRTTRIDERSSSILLFGI